MNYNHLHYFYVVAQTGSVTEAARVLNIAQPSLSSQIKSLESSIGKKLFFRVGRNLQLSPDGETVFEHCKKIFEAASVLESEVLGKESIQFQTDIGVATDIERPFLVEMVDRLLRRRSLSPTKKVRMSSESNEKLFRLLSVRSLDAIITSEPSFEPEFTTLASARMPIVLAYQADGQFRKFGTLSQHQIRSFMREQDISWVLPQKSMKLRQEIDNYFERAKILPNINFESDVLATVVRAVQSDVGVAFLPKPYIQTYTKSRSIRWAGPQEGFWQHGIWLIARKKDAGDEKLQALASAFRATIERGD